MSLTPKQARFVEEYLKTTDVYKAVADSSFKIKSCEEATGYYVYALIDPRGNQIFYIGKGKNRRFAAHENEWRSGVCSNPRKHSRIGDIMSLGLPVITVCLEDALSERDAYRLERTFINAVGREGLTNVSNGQVSAIEHLIAWAEDAAWRIMPYDEWLAVSPRSERDKEIYNFIVDEIIAILSGERTGERTIEFSTVED